MVNLALQQGHTVGASYYRQARGAVAVKWFPLDIRKPRPTLEAMQRFEPNAVIHTAYIKSGPDLWPVTVEGSAHVATAAQTLGARLIHVSSDLVFEGTQTHPYTEEDPAKPILPYGQAKRAAEQEVQTIYPRASVVRTSIIWGLNPPDPTSRFVLNLASGKQNGVLFYDEFRSFTYVEDLARALLELARRPHQGLLHIAGSQPLSRAGFGRIIAGHFGYSDGLPTASATESSEPRPLYCVLDCSKATALLQTPLRGVEEVLGSMQ